MNLYIRKNRKAAENGNTVEFARAAKPAGTAKAAKFTNVGKMLLLATIMAAVFILASQGVSAMSFTAFTASPHTDTKVRLDWSSVAGADTYRLSRDGGSGYSVVKTFDVNTEPNSLSYIDSGLYPETDYTYKIEAFQGTEPAIKLDEKTVAVATTKMIRPYGIQTVFDINARTAEIKWTSSAAATNTVIYRTENGSTSSTTANSTSSAIISVSGTAPVQISLKSTGNNSLESDVSDTATITPIAPPIITASSTGGTTTISWSTYACIGYFQLERSMWNGTAWDSWIPVNSSLSGQSTTDTPPTGGQYRYRLGAKSGSGYEGYGNISETVNGLPAPANLAATVTGSGTVSLTWVNGAGNTASIQVLRKQSDGTFASIAILGSTATSYTDSISISSGSTYTYRVRSYVSASNFSAAAEVSVTASLPAAPSHLSASVVSTSGITLNWTDNSNNETGFIIERIADNGNYTGIATLSANTTTYSDTAVTAGNTYVYRIYATGVLGNSTYSNEVTVSAWDNITPTSLTVTPVSSTRIDLSWSYAGSKSYNTVIERKTGTTGTWSVIYTTALGVLKYSDTGLTPNTQYFYRIRKSMGAGSYGLSYPNEAGYSASTNLSGLSLSGSAAANNTIYLTWSGNTGTADVVIERKMSSGSFSALTSVSYSTTGWYDDTGLVPGASYTYRIKAKTSTNESTYSNEVTVKNLYLDPPSLLTATVTSNGAIELNWRDNTTDETGFEIWRYIYGSGTYSLYATVDRNITTYTDTTVQRGVQYTYMVRAYVASGSLYSPYSNSAYIGTGLLNSPANLTYEYVSGSQVLLKWSDTSDNESGFKVERKIAPDGTWEIIAWLDPNVSAYNVTNLNPYTKYYFRIRAYSSTGNVDSLSNEILVSTAVPAAPSEVTAKALSTSQIRITWKDNSDSEEFFRILRRPPNGYNYTVEAEVSKNTTVYTDSNLIAGMTYSYKVASYNASGSSESSSVEAKTFTKATFSDLGKSASWARDAIENLAGMGIMKGVTGTKFMPDKTITKADFTAMVVRAFKLDTSPVGSLADVKSNKWYYKEIMIAENFGIISGDKYNKFYPEKAITREEIAVMLFKAAEARGRQLTIHDNSALEKFNDKNKITPGALASMATMVGEGIIEGLPGNSIGPQLTATRAQAAVMLYRVLNK